MKGICEGQKRPEEVIRDNVAMYKDVFVKSSQQMVKVEQAVAVHFGHGPDGPVADEPAEFVPVRNCPKCDQVMTLRATREGKQYIGCVGYPGCKWVLRLSRRCLLMFSQFSFDSQRIPLVPRKHDLVDRRPPERMPSLSFQKATPQIHPRQSATASRGARGGLHVV
jgi:hypothetical protein